jgi:predicted ArsR family transcriptional regulator
MEPVNSRKLYTLVSEDDVYRKLVHLKLSLYQMVGGAINIKNLAYLLHTSEYQVRKHMRSLRDKGIVELKCFNIPDDEEIYPPYWGYVLTEKGCTTEYYLKADEEHNRIIVECFGT